MSEALKEYHEALDFVLEVEGGPSNYGWDPGGDTVFGISKTVWPQYWKDGSPTHEVAERFYLTEFWNRLGLYMIDAQPLRVEIFEAAVNCGTSNAVKFVQRAYNLLRPRDWTELLEDGQLGPKTRTALNRLSEQYLDALLAGCNFYQAKYYEGLGGELREHAIRGWFAKRLLWQRNKV